MVRKVLDETKGKTHVLLSLYVTNPVNSIYISILYLLLVLYLFGVVKSFIQVTGKSL